MVKRETPLRSVSETLRLSMLILRRVKIIVIRFRRPMVFSVKAEMV
jgi:hypothetical protein